MREDHPIKGATWRNDASKAGKDPLHEGDGEVCFVFDCCQFIFFLTHSLSQFMKPKPGKHAYGANGQGDMKNKIIEPHASHVYFVVRDPRSPFLSSLFFSPPPHPLDFRPSDIVVQASDTTWQAYNTYGGTSTYGSYKDEDPRPRFSIFSSSFSLLFLTVDF